MEHEDPAVIAKKLEVHHQLIAKVQAIQAAKVAAIQAQVRAVEHARVAAELAVHTAKQVTATKVALATAALQRIAELKAAQQG